MDKVMVDTVFEFIRNYRNQENISPSYREIAEGCFIAQSTVEKYIIQLEGDNRITRKPGIARSIQIISESESEAE